ncbi:MAG: DUF1549 domain-containing protein [Armatimonadota bacterium]
MAALCPLVAVSYAAPSEPARRAAGSLVQQAHGILARRCFQCHSGGSSSPLDLRTREGALKGGKGGPAVVPGKPAESPLYRLVAATEGLRMPPGSPLPAAEQEVLRRWIAAGAQWPGSEESSWWSLRPLRRPAMPRVRRAAWVRSPIDAFVLARLEAQGLSPAPTADRRTLIRRLSFDLIGLPPTPEEVEAFVSDRRPDAYDRLVDRLLASPRYGERWARHWLDLARFAESDGFERDKLRDHAWRYRDYVIRAFNADKPYDRFVREQVAGDVLPDATGESVVATGFLVAGPRDEVGLSQASPVMRARAREDELEEIVAAVGQTFLGMTVNCARCHDHKFDPIPQADYFRLQAALAGVTAGNRPALSGSEQAAREREAQGVRERVADAEAAVDRFDREARKRVRAARGEPAPAEATVRPALRWSFESSTRDEAAGVELRLSGGAAVSGGRLVLSGTAAAESPPLPFELGAKTLEAWVRLADLDQKGGSALTVETPEGGAFDAIVFGERQPRRWMAGSENFRRTQDRSVAPETRAGERVHLAITYAADGRISLYRNGQPYGESYVPEARLHTYPAGSSRVLFGLRHTGARDRLSGEIEEARVYTRALTAEEVAASFREGIEEIPGAELLGALNPAERAERARHQAERDRLMAELKGLQAPPLVYAAVAQTAPKVYLLHRGDVEARGELLSPGGLSAIPGLSADFGLSPDAPDAERRRKLAEWLTHPKNPLTPRTLVNRVWQHHFGAPLAPSPSDLGRSGDLPSHPELLDFLASVFATPAAAGADATERRRDHRGTERQRDRGTAGVRAAALRGPAVASGSKGSRFIPLPSSFIPQEGFGWRVKRLHRLIVTSNTYKQAGRLDPRASAVDAENRLLWRQAPRRLQAEELRDAMLAVSGQLNLEAEGPGFRPFSITISNSHFYNYEDRTGPEYQRRSIYRTVLNGTGVPLLEAFDCPDPSVKTPRRSSTTTPLQALTLLNDSFVLRQSEALAARLEREAGPHPARQVERAYQLLFARAPTAAETGRAVAFAREQGLPALCRVLFNASELVYVR